MPKISASKAMIIILSAPSGGGKSSIIRNLLAQNKDFVFSISATTRKKRPNEKEGLDYFFLEEKIFRQMIEDNKFLEYTEIYGNLYGTPREYIEKTLSKGHNILLDIDYQGAYRIKKKISTKIISIFVKPPCINTLRTRLESRNQDSKEVIDKRIQLASIEISTASNYDYTVINDALHRVTLEIQQIITQ